MIYSSLPFFCFFFLGVLPLYFASQSTTYRTHLLIAASLVFYLWSGLFDTALFIVIVLTSWAAMWLAQKYPRLRRKWLMAGICVMAGNLVFWKYSGWLSEQARSTFPGIRVPEFLLGPLPIGISFFTLVGIAFLVDVLRNEAHVLGFKRYLLYMSFSRTSSPAPS